MASCGCFFQNPGNPTPTPSSGASNVPSSGQRSGDESPGPVPSSGAGLSGELAASVFYASSLKDPDGLSPDVTYPSGVSVSGATKEEAAENALKRLIAGPTPDEEKAGFYSAIPKGVKLNYVRRSGNRIVADFSKKLNEGGGSFDMQQRRSQIENTLRSIYKDSSDEVVISVDGNTEQALQP